MIAQGNIHSQVRINTVQSIIAQDNILSQVRELLSQGNN